MALRGVRAYPLAKRPRGTRWRGRMNKKEKHVLYYCGILSAFFVIAPSASAAEPSREPSFLHGLGEVIDGLVLELPKTILEGTLGGPPVVGTVIGALAGTAQAAQKTVAGVLEMSEGFDPWETKRRQ